MDMGRKGPVTKNARRSSVLQYMNKIKRPTNFVNSARSTWLSRRYSLQRIHPPRHVVAGE